MTSRVSGTSIWFQVVNLPRLESVSESSLSLSLWLLVTWYSDSPSLNVWWIKQVSLPAHSVLQYVRPPLSWGPLPPPLQSPPPDTLELVQELEQLMTYPDGESFKPQGRWQTSSQWCSVSKPHVICHLVGSYITWSLCWPLIGRF